MTCKYSHLFSPGQIGTLKLKNRVVMAPVDSIFRTEAGAFNEQHQFYLGARAAGGVGLIVCDNATVDYPRGAVGSKAARLDQDRFTAALNEVADEVHLWDAAIMMQICHAGRQTTLGGSQGIPLVSASAIAWDYSGTIPVELSISEVKAMINAFADAAVRVHRAGCDGVEVHACNGYLLSSFMSRALNQRGDRYGGSITNRGRIVVEIIKEIRDRLGDYPVTVRMNVRDGIPGGIEPPEAAEFAAMFEEAGVDAIHVSAGTYEASAYTFPPMMFPQGVNLGDIKYIKDAVSIPVIGVGRFTEPAFADQAVADGKIDFVAMARALLADPEWANKARRGAEDEIRPCIGCNHGCICRIDRDLSMRCNVNPDLGREITTIGAKTPANPKSIMVVGAGPAGVEFAVRAKARGHKIQLFEASSKVGGQLNLAQVPEFKREVNKLIRWYETMLKKNGVDIKFNQTVTKELVDKINPDAVVVATGGKPSVPFDHPEGGQFVTYEDVLLGKVNPQGSAVVIGGGSTGAELAAHLARKGVKVTLIEMTGSVAAAEDPSIQQFLAGEFQAHGVDVRTNTQVMQITKDTVQCLNLTNARPVNIPYKNLIIAAGVKSDNGLADELEASGREVYRIGDCNNVGTVLEATERAARIVERRF
jgi:2,4-dienoyl-CoA reductase-like NADH-dependent reductase (Old Yellow Enzyme family)/pyruvate/2-oxoglutarate dehydrogenase complex dihydrolipoamide dehydrogenase (E3) component